MTVITASIQMGKRVSGANKYRKNPSKEEKEKRRGGMSKCNHNAGILNCMQL